MNRGATWRRPTMSWAGRASLRLMRGQRPMTTPERAEINRRNAQKSTGPKTPEGQEPIAVQCCGQKPPHGRQDPRPARRGPRDVSGADRSLDGRPPACERRRAIPGRARAAAVSLASSTAPTAPTRPGWPASSAPHRPRRPSASRTGSLACWADASSSGPTRGQWNSIRISPTSATQLAGRPQAPHLLLRTRRRPRGSRPAGPPVGIHRRRISRQSGCSTAGIPRAPRRPPRCRRDPGSRPTSSRRSASWVANPLGSARPGCRPEVAMIFLACRGARPESSTRRSRSLRRALEGVAFAGHEDRLQAAVGGTETFIDHWSPGAKPRARAVLLGIVEKATSRLKALVAVHQERAEADAAEQAARLSFDGSVEGERLRRYQGACNRALFRTLDTLLKLRRSASSSTGGGKRGRGVRERDAGMRGAGCWMRGVGKRSAFSRSPSHGMRVNCIFPPPAPTIPIPVTRGRSALSRRGRDGRRDLCQGPLRRGRGPGAGRRSEDSTRRVRERDPAIRRGGR